MIILQQAAYYILFLLVGEMLSVYTSIPAGICGMSFALVLLSIGLIKIENIELFGRYILSIASFILLPLFAEGWEHKNLLLPIFWKWILIIIVSTTLTLVVISLTLQVVQNFFFRHFSGTDTYDGKGNNSKI